MSILKISPLFTGNHMSGFDFKKLYLAWDRNFENELYPSNIFLLRI